MRECIGIHACCDTEEKKGIRRAKQALRAKESALQRITIFRAVKYSPALRVGSKDHTTLLIRFDMLLSFFNIKDQREILMQ